MYSSYHNGCKLCILGLCDGKKETKCSPSWLEILAKHFYYYTITKFGWISMETTGHMIIIFILKTDLLIWSTSHFRPSNIKSNRYGLTHQIHDMHAHLYAWTHCRRRFRCVTMDFLGVRSLVDHDFQSLESVPFSRYLCLCNVVCICIMFRIII